MSEQSLLKDIPPETLDQECSNRFLADVARMITQWQMLAPYFDISRGEEQSIRESFRDYDKQKQEFLCKWKENNPGRATNRALLGAIYSSSAVDLAHNVCQLLQQNYCQATTSSTPVVPAISPLLLEYQSKLKMKYRIHKPVMATEWPPPCSFGYVQLVLVPREPIERGEITNEEVYDKICLNIDEAIDTSEEVDIETLLAINSGERKVILFEGAPGSGKSTLLWHITQMWQSGEQFQQFTLVLLVQLKDPAVRMAKSLADLLPPRSKAEQVASEIEAIQGEGVLIMLDGWDEAPADLREEGSFFHDLIAKPCDWSVEKAAIVVSSRPPVFSELWIYLSNRVELRGLTQEMRDKYISETLSPDDSQCLIDKIDSFEENDTVDLSLPLNVASLIHIFSTSGGDLPPTPCRIAIKLILSFIFRHIKKAYPNKNSVKSLNSFEDLPQPTNEWFQCICKIAYNGIVEEKFVFTSEDLAIGPGSSMHQIKAEGEQLEVVTLGLLHPEHSLVSVGSSTVYHFLHLSHQELCAAYYVATLPDTEKRHIEALKRVWHSYSFEYVANFYSALTAPKIRPPQEIHSLYVHYEFILRTQSRSESDSSDISDKDESDESHIVEINESDDLSVIDSFGSQYPLTLKGCGHLSVSVLDFAMESMNPEFIDILVGKVISGYIYRETAAPFAYVISEATSLESLTYFMYYISPKLFHALANKKNLEKFVLKAFYCISNCNEFEAMKTALPTCPNLKDVHIFVQFSKNVSQISVITQTFENMKLNRLNINAKGSIEDAEVAALAPAFVGTASVTLTCKEVGSIGLEKLKDVLLQSTSLYSLSVVVDEYYGEEDREFFGSLRKTPSLYTISLSNTDQGDASIMDSAVGRVLLSGDLVELAQIFGLDSPLVVDKILHIHVFNSCFKIDFKNKCFKSVSLVGCQSKLNRWFEKRKEDVKCPIKLNGIKMLCASLQSIVVEELNLMAHEIGNNGAFVFKDAIPTMYLKELIIRECNIGEEGIAAVFCSLAHNKTLTTLDAACNNFGDNGAVEIARFINKTPLELLDIGNCGIGERGIAAIAGSLQTNTTLRRLGLYSDNQVLTQYSEAELLRMLVENETLSALHVNLNSRMYWCDLHSNSVYRTFIISQASMQCLMIDLDAREVYRAIKISPLIASIGVDRTSNLGQAITSGDMELAGEILQLNQLPHGKGKIKLNMDDGTIWTVDYNRKKVILSTKDSL